MPAIAMTLLGLATFGLAAFGPAGNPLLATAAEELKLADSRAGLAKALDPGEAKDKALAGALKAYDLLLKRYPKDLKLVPRLRRRRAGLFKHAGRIEEAIAEHDRIVEGRARRKDKARALYDAAVLLRRADRPAEADRRLVRALEDYKDIAGVRAKALLARGEILCSKGKTREARRVWEELTRRCRDEAKTAIAGYDALALLALDEGDAKGARRWLERCVRCYGKRAERADRRGAFLSRQLGEMKAPARLAEVEAGGTKGG